MFSGDSFSHSLFVFRSFFGVNARKLLWVTRESRTLGDTSIVQSPESRKSFFCLTNLSFRTNKVPEESLSGVKAQDNGMLLCAKADLAAEVRTAASAYPSEDGGSDEQALNAGMWGHAKKILS